MFERKSIACGTFVSNCRKVFVEFIKKNCGCKLLGGFLKNVELLPQISYYKVKFPWLDFMPYPPLSDNSANNITVDCEISDALETKHTKLW